MINAILFDFDGVILDSMGIKTDAFAHVLSGHPADAVKKLLDYHICNGGISRFRKFRYFYEDILGTSVSDDTVAELSSRFSVYVTEKLTDGSRLIPETVEFIRRIHGKLPLHIVSGAEENELRFICQQLNIDSYFVSISGSPTPKPQLVASLLSEYRYRPEEVILIGDSVNDYDAATENRIRFFGFNNPTLRQTGAGYIETYQELPF